MSAELRSTEQSRPGLARATLDALRKRWGVVETWKAPPAMVFVSAPSGRETWTRIDGDVYELREVQPRGLIFPRDGGPYSVETIHGS